MFKNIAVGAAGSSDAFSVAPLFESVGAPQRLAVGRCPTSPWCLTSLEFPLLISREHAYLSRLGPTVSVCDNSSTNGTYVNDTQLPCSVPRPLQEGDVVSFGGPKTVYGQSTNNNPFVFRLEGLAALNARLARPSGPSAPGRPARTTPVVLDLTEDDGGEVQLISSVTPKPKRRRTNAQPPKSPDWTAAPMEVSPAPASAGPGPSAEAGAKSKDVLGKLESDLECVICRDWMVAAHSFAPCGHSFCGLCLAGWLESKNNCPCCRQKATGAPHRALPLDNIISSIIEPTLTQEDKERRAASLAEWQKKADKTANRWKQLLNPAAPPRGPHMHLPELPWAAMEHMEQYNIMQAIAGSFGPRMHVGHPAAHVPPVHHHMARYPGAWAPREGSQARTSLHAEVTPRREANVASIRCQGCNNCFNQNQLRMKTRNTSGSSNWYHLGCLPAHRWAGAHAGNIHGMSSLSQANQNSINRQLARSL